MKAKITFLCLLFCLVSCKKDNIEKKQTENYVISEMVPLVIISNRLVI